MNFEWHSSARRPQAVIAIVGVWAVLLLLYVVVDAAWWVLMPFALFTLPAIYDFARGSVSGFTIDETHIRWHGPRMTGEVPISGIDYMRFDTRLDLALNARLHLTDHSTVRIPPESVPPYAQITEALDARGIRHERHDFGF